jgi:hypothetical protein
MRLKTTSVQRPRLSKPTKGEQIDTFSLGYVRARNRNAAHSLVLDCLEDSGVTKAELAKALRKEPSQITRWLGSAGNLTIDSLSDLLFAANGSLLELRAYDPFDQAKNNHQAIAGYRQVHIEPSHGASLLPKNLDISTSSKSSNYVRL